MSSPPRAARSQAVDVSLVFPAYNESGSIQRTLELATTYLGGRGLPYEIIVAADGTDGTREVAQSFAEKMAPGGPGPENLGVLRVIGGPERRGKGRGVQAGVRLATGRIVGFADADNKTPVDDLDRLLPYFDEGYDVVIGSRASAGSTISRHQPAYRRAGSRVFAAAMHTVTGLWEIRDTQCGFKFFRGEVAHDVFERQTVMGYMFDVDILSIAMRRGYRIKEVGIRWSDDADSRLALVADNWNNTRDLLRVGLLNSGYRLKRLVRR